MEYELTAYATVDDVEAGFRELTDAEKDKCGALIVEAGVMIDTVASGASCAVKKIVTCRMVRRAIGNGEQDMPMGATQGTVSALGYSQTWTMGNGASTGELYIGKTEKTMLGVSNKIGASNPFGGDAVC